MTLFASRAADSACSLPPCGGRVGRGVATNSGALGFPPPCPSPTGGEGTLWHVLTSTEIDRARERTAEPAP
jgi:hypothetical protein